VSITLGNPQNVMGRWTQKPTKRRLFSLEIKMLSIFRRLMKNENGATAIEYTLIASLIAVAAITAMKTVGGKVNNTLNTVGNSLT